MLCPLSLSKKRAFCALFLYNGKRDMLFFALLKQLIYITKTRFLRAGLSVV